MVIRHWAIAFMAAVALLSCVGLHPCFGKTIVDKACGFTLTLPDGFVPVSKPVGAASKIVHLFALGDPSDGKPHIALIIAQMGGTIDRERLKQEQMPPGFQGRLFTTSWQGFDVDEFEVPEQVGDAKWLNYNVQIPLKLAAIQITLTGPADRKAELTRLMRETLDGLHGESNWLRSAMALLSNVSSRTYGVVLVALCIVLVVGGLVVFWLISKRTPRGTVLGIAAAIWLASWLAEGIQIREVLALSGAVRLLGFAGMILGIIDGLRRRKPRHLPPMPCQDLVAVEDVGRDRAAGGDMKSSPHN